MTCWSSSSAGVPDFRAPGAGRASLPALLPACGARRVAARQLPKREVQALGDGGLMRQPPRSCTAGACSGCMPWQGLRGGASSCTSRQQLHVGGLQRISAMRVCALVASRWWHRCCQLCRHLTTRAVQPPTFLVCTFAEYQPGNFSPRGRKVNPGSRRATSTHHIGRTVVNRNHNRGGVVSRRWDAAVRNVFSLFFPCLTLI